MATKKTTRRMSVKREPGFGSPTPSLKRTFAEMDSADDAASDTTDSGSEVRTALLLPQLWGKKCCVKFMTFFVGEQRGVKVSDIWSKVSG